MNQPSLPLDHGGGLDGAIAQYGGAREAWLDLSTGINPHPYPISDIDPAAWHSLPDENAAAALISAARVFWKVPDIAEILAAPGASSLIARIPALAAASTVGISTPTYNEHAASFRANGWTVTQTGGTARVVVHPNNPDGKLWVPTDLNSGLSVIDESFCDVCPDQTMIELSKRPGTLVLKSFGKFWGLAGMRLGFAIGDPELIGRLAEMLGPWPVSGPALSVGARALSDPEWAGRTRERLARDAIRLDDLMRAKGAEIVGGTDLFRLYEVQNARHWQDHLARKHIWSRVFPYSDRWLRLGLPATDRWHQLERAL